MSAPDPWTFSFEPLFLLLALGASVLYVRDLREAPSGGRPGGLRQVCFFAGVGLCSIPLNSPLETLSAHYLLIFHLLQNAMVADWGPPLLILGLSPEQRRRIGRRGGRPFARVTEPRVAIALWLVAWYGVHLPLFYDWALRHGWPLNAEHAILISAGLVFWWAPLAVPRRLDALGVAGYLGVAFVASPWLSLAYIWSSQPFYGFYGAAPRLWGISAVRDQSLAGILMNVEQTLVFLVALAWALLRVLDEEEEAQRLIDAGRYRASPPGQTGDANAVRSSALPMPTMRGRDPGGRP